MGKPSYTSSRRYLWACFFLAWAVILLITIGTIMGSEQAASFGAIALPAMVGMIVGNLGLHRGFGSSDFRAAANHLPREPPAINQEGPKS